MYFGVGQIKFQLLFSRKCGSYFVTQFLCLKKCFKSNFFDACNKRAFLFCGVHYIEQKQNEKSSYFMFHNVAPIHNFYYTKSSHILRRLKVIEWTALKQLKLKYLWSMVHYISKKKLLKFTLEKVSCTNNT